MSLIRVCKWLGLIVCLLIAVAIPLSIVVHYRGSNGNDRYFIAHGAVTMERGVPLGIGFSRRCRKCCPDDSFEQLGLVAPVTRTKRIDKLATAPLPATQPTGSANGSPLLVQTVHPLWEILLIVGLPTLCFWIAERPFTDTNTAAKRRDSALRRRMIALAFVGVVMFGSYFVDVWIVRKNRWSIALQLGALCVTGANAAAQLSTDPRTPVFFRDEQESLHFGDYLLGAKWHWLRPWINMPSMFSALYYWGVLIPMWLPILLIAAPTLVLFVHTRRPQPGSCDSCGYNLTGNISGVCPECGTAIDRLKWKARS